MELWRGGQLVVYIQFPGVTRDERRAFQASFRRYGYLEGSGSAPVALWIFDFPQPHGPIDVNFDARVVPQDVIDDYLDEPEGEPKNALLFFLLDGPILRAQKLVGLNHEAVRLFHATIRKQLDAEYSHADYGKHLAGLWQYTTPELLKMAKVFRHKGG